jgi:hypothetical protein
VYDFGVTTTFLFSGRAVVSKLGPACRHSLQRLRAIVKSSRLTEISSHLQNELSDADWTTKREIIRALYRLFIAWFQIRLLSRRTRVMNRHAQNEAQKRT